MTKSHGDTAAFYDAIADTYSEQYRGDRLREAKEYPANYFRLQILTAVLKRSGLRSVYEVGVGEGTPLAVIAGLGLRVAGCDISKNMVEAARSNFKTRGLDPQAIQWGDIEVAASFAGQIPEGGFDAVIAAGVLPHVKDDKLMLGNIGTIVRPGGKVFIEFRNKLFSLFTFNRYTKDFILDDLLAGVSAEVKQAVAKELDARLAAGQPPVRAGASTPDTPDYGSLLAKFHNPFELIPFFEDNGYVNAKVHWYHYHPAPPLLESALGRTFRDAAIALEHEGSWRGYFLCSAGVIEADRAA